MSDRLGAAWREYRTRVIPLDAPVIQAQECRRAFYAGARGLLSIMVTALEPGTDPTPGDLRMMDDLADELDEFARAVDPGVMRRVLGKS